MKKDAGAATLPSVLPRLQALGLAVRHARLARGWTIAEAAVRTLVSTATWKRIEAGDPSVSMAYWANALEQLGLLDAALTAAAAADHYGNAVREARAPKRARRTTGKDVDLDAY